MHYSRKKAFFLHAMPFLAILSAAISSVSFANDFRFSNSKDFGAGSSYREYVVSGQSADDLKNLFGESLYRVFYGLNAHTYQMEKLMLLEKGVSFGFSCRDESWAANLYLKTPDTICHLRTRSEVLKDDKTGLPYLKLSFWDGAAVGSSELGVKNEFYKSQRRLFDRMMKNYERGLAGYSSLSKDNAVQEGTTSNQVEFSSKQIDYICYLTEATKDKSRYIAHCEGRVNLE